MSVLIKGMKMPTRCEDCFCYLHNAEYDYAYCNISSVNVLGHGNARPVNCPMVELPAEHGRLIDADALTDFLKYLFPDRGMWEIEGDTAKDAICETVVEAMEMVKNMETIKPERRKRGHWEPVTNGRGGHQCDRCGCYAPSYQSGTEWLSDFCPNCGADMREEEQDATD